MSLNRSFQQMGCWAVVALLALRLGTGWHFFKEGAEKLRGEGYPTALFLQASKGPFAEMHKSMLPDRWGFERLNRKSSEVFWNKYKSKVESKLRFNADQSEAATQLVKTYNQRLKRYLGDNKSDIQEYYLELKRYREATKEKTAKIPFQEQRLIDKEAELKKTVTPWLNGIKQFDAELENGLNGIADSSQQSRGRVKIPDRTQPIADKFVKYVVFGVGVLLILGLFTRLACLAGIGFLLTVMSTQPPWSTGAVTDYFYYQMVEVLAFCVLFAFAAGRLLVLIMSSTASISDSHNQKRTELA